MQTKSNIPDQTYQYLMSKAMRCAYVTIIRQKQFKLKYSVIVTYMLFTGHSIEKAGRVDIHSKVITTCTKMAQHHLGSPPSEKY